MARTGVAVMAMSCAGHGGGGPQMSEENGMAPAVGTAFGKGAKSIYTCLYIYAKGPLVLHKYTAVTAALRGVISGKTHQTRTGFAVFGAVLGPCEGRKSNNLLQNRDIQAQLLFLGICILLRV